MKKVKYVLGLTLVMSLMLSLFAGCGSTPAEDPDDNMEPTEVTTAPEVNSDPDQQIPTDPMETITYGRYVYSYFAEGHGDYTYYFHFYEEDPVLGAVFYAGLVNNGMNFVGTYKVEESPCDYVCAKDREELLAEKKAPGTAPYTIIFYDWEGNELDRCGFDGEIIYNDMTEIAGSGSNEVYYIHDTEGDASPYAATYDGEVGVAYLDFAGAEDSTISLTLNHNMTYTDLVDMIVEGAWTMEKNSDGTSVYTLTPADAADTGATVTVSADRNTAQYQANGSSDVVELVSTMMEEPELMAQYEGSFFMEAYGLDAALAMKLYSDGSAVFEADVFGNIQALDEGMYVDNGDGTYAVGMNTGAQVECDGQIVHYVGTTAAGDMDVELTLNPDAAGPSVQFSFTGTYCTFDCMSDGTFVFAFADMGLEETGTWKWADFAFTITKSDGAEIAVDMDPDTRALSFTYNAVINDQLADTFTCDVEVWGAAVQ